jgi:hypothetical protein
MHFALSFFALTGDSTERVGGRNSEMMGISALRLPPESLLKTPNELELSHGERERAYGRTAAVANTPKIVHTRATLIFAAARVCII